jgi:penicillin-binding protein 1A
VGDYPEYLSTALGAGETTVLKLTNAYAILANHGRAVSPTLIDFVQDRRGKVIFRTDNRCSVMEGRCNAPDWNGGAMPRPPSRARQVLDPQAAFQMVHILTGVIERGTATVLRDLNRPIFGKTGTTSGPRDVWFIGGTPDVVAGVYLGYDQPRNMGGAAQGGRLAAPIWKQWAEASFKDVPPTPFIAPEGIRMVRIDRVSGRRVFGTFPVTEDPKSAVIWEAFKPETEPRRVSRQEETAAAAAPARPSRRRAPAPRPRSEQREAPRPAEPTAPAEDFLAREGGIY